VKQFDMDEFRIKPEHLKTLKPGAGVVGKAAARSKPVSGIKRRDAFAAVPLWWAARAVKGRANPNLLVCVDLVHRACRRLLSASIRNVAAVTTSSPLLMPSSTST
jgi:hypothetical protein